MTRLVHCPVGQLTEFMYFSCISMLQFDPVHSVVKLKSGTEHFIADKDPAREHRASGGRRKPGPCSWPA